MAVKFIQCVDAAGRSLVGTENLADCSLWTPYDPMRCEV